MSGRDEGVALFQRIANGGPVFVIAEAGVNHNGDTALAMELIDRAATAGADAVKFQTFRTEELVTAQATKADYQLETTSTTESQAAMLKRLELPSEVWGKLAARARERGLAFLSTPFDVPSVDFLDRLDLPMFKVGSGDVTNSLLLKAVGGWRRPVLLSTGMAYLSEVAQALELLGRAGAKHIALLHCVSQYPAPAAEANIKAIRRMADAFGIPIGYSDHADDELVTWAAVAVGARIIEKHLTLDRSLPGPDHRASLEPDALAAYVRRIRALEQILGTGEKVPAPCEVANRRLVRRSLGLRSATKAGMELTESMLVALRPGTGISPIRWMDVVGRKMRRDLRAGELLDWSDFA